MMRRLVVMAAVLGLVASACTGGSKQSQNNSGKFQGSLRGRP